MTQKHQVPSKLLHIYAQPWQHADAYIIGSKAALTVLRDAIDRAIVNGIGETESTACLVTADGEVFGVRIACGAFKNAMLPYVSDIEFPDSGDSPYSLFCETAKKGCGK